MSFFSITTKPSLSDDFNFYAVSETAGHTRTIHFDARDPVTGADGRIEYHYDSYDSEEGQVIIAYIPIDADDQDTSYDVEVIAGSDVWSLKDTQFATAAAFELHRFLGRGDDTRLNCFC
jgi:hypothetical protein